MTGMNRQAKGSESPEVFPDLPSRHLRPEPLMDLPKRQAPARLVQHREDGLLTLRDVPAHALRWKVPARSETNCDAAMGSP